MSETEDKLLHYRKPFNPKKDWQIVLELAEDWPEHGPYWAFSIFEGEENVGVGSADTLEMCMSMAHEMYTDVRSGFLRKGIKVRNK